MRRVVNGARGTFSRTSMPTIYRRRLFRTPQRMLTIAVHRTGKPTRRKLVPKTPREHPYCWKSFVGWNKMAMYPELMVVPMREELTRLGIEEAKTAEAVDQAVAGTKGTLMVIVNSICGCAAGKMRPAVRMALQGSTAKPDKSISVFAGQDQEA